MEDVQVGLSTISNGEAVAVFDEEFSKLLENVLDPNTEAKKKRTITLQVVVAPTEDRERCIIAWDVKTKLMGPKAQGDLAYMGRTQEGQAVAVKVDPGQLSLLSPDGDPAHGVLPIRSLKEGTNNQEGSDS